MNKKVEIVLAKYGCLFMKDDNKEMFSEIEEVYKESQAEQLILSGVVTRLPIGTEITIINKESFKEDAGTKKTITGHCDYLDKPVGYLCDDEGIFLIEDFVR